MIDAAELRMLRNVYSTGIGFGPTVIALIDEVERGCAENARLKAAWKIAEPHLPELKYRQSLAALRELRDTATDICARVELAPVVGSPDAWRG